MQFYRQLDAVVIDDTQLFNDKLQEWGGLYNFHRPTAAAMDRPPTNGYDSEPGPGRKRPTSAAHLVAFATTESQATHDHS